MKLRLATHIALWAVTDFPKLAVTARELILAPENLIYVSAATLWEIAIKCALMGGGEGNRAGHIDMPVSAARAAALFALSDYQPLPMDWAHAQAVSALPTMKSHADPFDRMLVTQARCEQMTLSTRDAAVADYGERVMLV